jgi:hypothetical protein
MSQERFQGKKSILEKKVLEVSQCGIAPDAVAASYVVSIEPTLSRAGMMGEPASSGATSRDAFTAVYR